MSSSKSLGPLALFVDIADTSDRGRVLVTKRDFAAGDTVFADMALINASWNEDECIECGAVKSSDAPHASIECPRLASLGYPPALASNIDAVELAICHARVPEDESEGSDR